MLGELQLQNVPPISFTGLDRTLVKRKALDYWYQHRQRLGLSLHAFLSRCRRSGDGLTITFGR